MIIRKYAATVGNVILALCAQNACEKQLKFLYCCRPAKSFVLQVNSFGGFEIRLEHSAVALAQSSDWTSGLYCDVTAK
jgi:hypothetical protein